MLLVGSDDGVYHVDGFDDRDRDSASTTRLLGGGRARRIRTFEGIDGVFAATDDGLFHSVDGQEWTDLGVPEGVAYSVGASSDGERVYAGTRPAAIYVTESVDAIVAERETPDQKAASEGRGAADGASDDRESTLAEEPDEPIPYVEWRELDDFQELPSREEWRLPRHENLAQVRDVTADPGGEGRIVAGVEVGGVHLSEDGGETWAERTDGVHDDVHELHVVDDGHWVAATGYGLYRTQDAGQSWERLDEDVDQRYFRTAFSVDGDVYAGANMANSTTWNDEDADPGFFRVREGGPLEEYPLPKEAGTVTGMTAVDGDLVLATHRGHLYVERAGEAVEVGRFPVPGDVGGRYTPLTWVEA